MSTLPAAPPARIASHCVCCASGDLKRSPAILMPFIAHRTFGWAPVEITDEWGLKSIPNGMAYSICQTLECSACGLLFLDIRFDDNELGKLYDGYREEAYVALRDHYEPGYRLRNEALNAGVYSLADVETFLRPHLASPLRLLDWGGDTGKNTPFKDHNALFHIYDISNKPVVDGAVKVGKEQALATDYNLIVCSNVLEHTPYPADVINEMRQCMGPDTVLFIEVPQEELVRTAAPGAALHGKKRHWHEHINFYTASALENMLERCGLALLGLETTVPTATRNAAYMVACKRK